jgi:hypothetical protein
MPYIGHTERVIGVDFEENPSNGNRDTVENVLFQEYTSNGNRVTSGEVLSSPSKVPFITEASQPNLDSLQ